MNAGDGLHHAAITMPQAMTVDMLQLAQIGAAVLCNGHAHFTVQNTRHGAWPDQLGIELLIGKTVCNIEMRQHFVGAGENRRNKFQQGFGIIGGNRRMSQCGAQALRMRLLADHSLRRAAQAFFFQTTVQLSEQRLVGGLG